MTEAEIHKTIETVFRMERAKLIAGLARMVRDVSQAEELAQDALVTALSDWPKNGVPRNPGAWLMAAAKRRAIDGFRRNKMLKRKHEEIVLIPDQSVGPQPEPVTEGNVTLLPIKTHVLTDADHMAEVVAKYVSPVAQEGDIVVMAESVVAITQRRYLIPDEHVKPSSTCHLDQLVR